MAAQLWVAAVPERGGSPKRSQGHRKCIEAFDREFVFVGVTARVSRETALLTGSCEIRDSAETAASLAVLDATNRWIAHMR